jgi:hypothetical protein
MSKEAMKLALEALETYHGYMEPLTTVFGGPRVPAEQSTTGKVERAITSLRQALEEALAKQEQGEPVAFKIYLPKTPRQDVNHGLLPWVYDQDPSSGNVASMWVTPVKNTPQKRTWVGLTEQEQGAIMEDLNAHGTNLYPLTQAIEAKLKEKNT